MNQTIDFETQDWSRTILINDCEDIAFEDSWDFQPGTGPIYEPEVVEPEEEPVDEEAVFQEGFDDGFDKGID